MADSFERFLRCTLQRDLFEAWLCFQLQPGNHPAELERLRAREATKPFEEASKEIVFLFFSSLPF